MVWPHHRRLRAAVARLAPSAVADVADWRARDEGRDSLSVYQAERTLQGRLGADATDEEGLAVVRENKRLLRVQSQDLTRERVPYWPGDGWDYDGDPLLERGTFTELFARHRTATIDHYGLTGSDEEMLAQLFAQVGRWRIAEATITSRPVQQELNAWRADVEARRDREVEAPRREARQTATRVLRGEAPALQPLEEAPLASVTPISNDTTLDPRD